MAELVTNCPRCGANEITFDVPSWNFIREDYGWLTWYEVFGVCRKCQRSTMLVLSRKDASLPDTLQQNDSRFSDALNTCFDVQGYISLKDNKHEQAPEHVPKEIAAIFDEGATCLAVNCFNAAGTMFRLCVDMATRALLPPPGSA